LPQWLLLWFAPKTALTRVLLKFQPAVFVLAVLYVIGFWTGGGTEIDFQDFTHYAGVKKLFQSGNAVAVGWIHYLAFDLWVGSYIVQNAQKIRFPHPIAAVCSAFTFMMGPTGLLLYWLARWGYSRIKN
jgi:hypothetical protein